MSLDDLDYELPEGRIAQSPVHPRHDSRLLIVPRRSLGSTPKDISLVRD